MAPSLRSLRRGFRLVAARHTSVFAYLMGLGLGCPPWPRKRGAGNHGSRGGPASLGTSASNRRLGGSRPAPVLCRLTGVPPQWWAGVFSGVFRLKPAPPSGGRQRQKTAAHLPSPPPVRRGRRRTHSGGTETTLQTHMVSTLLEIYERHIDTAQPKRRFKHKASSTPAARPRQILILNFNYVYSQN